jgi:tyrosinase
MMSVKKHLTMLLRRPQEPVFTMTNDDGRRCFNLPDELLSDRHQTLCQLLKAKNGDAHDELMQSAMTVKKTELPDLSAVMGMARDEQFSLWIPRHKKLAARLIEVFMETRDLDELLSVAVYARDRVNPLLFHYALSVVLMHRPDTKSMELPSFLSAFPDRFVDPIVVAKLREEAAMVEDPGNRIPVTIPQNFTYSDEVDEHK